jgi:integrase/recombinase XerD
MDLRPNARIDRLVVTDYVAWRRKSCGDVTVAIDLDHLRGALRLICPGVDWSWLLIITKRIAAAAPRRHPKYHLVTSDRLYALGLELMDGVITDADAAKHMSKAQAFQYRDGLIIALRALIPLRSRTVVAMRIGIHLVKTGDLWGLDIPAADTKSQRPLDYPIPRELSARIDLYLERFRSRIPGAERHTALWASNQGRPMCAMAIYDAVRNRTRKAFGFAVNLHRFRHAAASFWSIQDPANVRGAKGPVVVWYDRETLHHGAITRRGSCARPCCRCSAEMNSGGTGRLIPCRCSSWHCCRWAPCQRRLNSLGEPNAIPYDR